MYYRDHAPPHFHAIYAEHEAEFEIDTMGIIEGNLPRKVRSLVSKWGADHKDELLQNWDLARNGEVLMQIDPN